MIKINGKEYCDYDIKIDWGKFEHIICDDKINWGKFEHGATIDELNEMAPFIKFNINNEIFIGIECILSKEEFLNLELNKLIKLNKYISDITYEDEKGWISIVTGNFDCKIIRISANLFKLDFFVKSDEYDINDIEIKTDIYLL